MNTHDVELEFCIIKQCLLPKSELFETRIHNVREVVNKSVLF